MDLLIYLFLSLPALIGAAILFFRIRASLAWVFAVGGAFVATAMSVAIAYHAAKNNPGVIGLQSKSIEWAGTWGFDFSFHFNALSLCFLLCSSLVFFLSILLARFELEQQKAKSSALLFLMSCTLAALSAKTIFLFTFFSLASLLPVIALIGLDVSPDRPSVLRRYAITVFIADLLFFLVALYLHPKFKAGISEWFAIIGEQYQVAANVLCFFLLAIACLIRLGLFPFHFYRFELFSAKKIDTLIPVVSVVGVGFYAFFNFVPQFFPQEVKQYASVLGVFAVISVFFSAFALLRADSTRQRVMHLQLFMSGLIVLGFASLHRIGWSGAWMTAVFQILIIAFLMQLIAISERRITLFKMSELGRAPFYAITSAYASIAAYGIPISFGFYAMVFVFWGVCEGMHKGFVIALASVPILILSSIKMFFFKIRGAPSGAIVSDTQTFQDADRIEIFSMAPLLFLLVTIGIFPDLLLKFVTIAVDSTLAALSGGL